MRGDYSKLLLLIVIILFSSLFIGAACDKESAQDIVSEGTDFVFIDKSSVDYVLVLDRSGSMRGEKIFQAKEASRSLISQLSRGDRAAIVAFDTNPVVYSSFTDDQEVLLNAIDKIVPGDYTKYGPALEKASNLFNGNRKVIVLLTDGKPDDNANDLESTIKNVISDEVCLFTIAYADSADDEAQKVLKDISSKSYEELGCGEYFRAEENSFDLRNAFEEIYTSVSGEEIFDVDVDVAIDDRIKMVVTAKSILNNKSIFGQYCFQPSISYVILRNKEIVFEKVSEDREIFTDLPAGEYEYYVTVQETCGGECLLSGRTSGKFRAEPGQLICNTPWEELSILISSNEYIEVHITPDGFEPQTVATDGIVVWKNLDTVPRRIRSPDGSFLSPYIQPGESWTKTFSPGVYSYIDATSSYTGLVKNDKVPSHKASDLVLILDKSGSMAGTPLESAKGAAKNLLSILTPADRASLIVFSDKGQVAQQLTSSNKMLINAVDEVLSEGSTYYIEAIQLAGQQLAKSSSNRNEVVIFLSDGAPFDKGGKKAILESVENNFGDSCLYAIGYGEQGREAVDLLNSMADFIQEKNGCGKFYFSSADKTALSKVFGEIYALTQEPGMVIHDISIPDEASGSFEVSVRVRSRINGVEIPSVSTFGCIPPADVSITFGNLSFPLSYANGEYKGMVELPAGEYHGVITAILSASDDPTRVVVGNSPVKVTVKGINWLLWILIAFGLLVVLYFFMRKRNP